MNKPGRQAGIVAAALLAACPAFAGLQGDFAWGKTLSHGTTEGDDGAPVIQWDLGYRSGDVAAQVIAFGQVDLFRNFLENESTARYGFDRFIGIEAVGYLPLASRFEALGGIGVGRSTLNNGFVDQPDRKNTDAVLTAGLQWHAAPHFNLGVDANYLSKTEVLTLVVRSQLAF